MTINEEQPGRREMLEHGEDSPSGLPSKGILIGMGIPGNTGRAAQSSFLPFL